MTAAGRRLNTRTSDDAIDTGHEAEYWRMADALRGSMDAAEYKHVVPWSRLLEVHLRRL